jgi:transcriptional regulator with XRE-family HTH domain
MSIKPEVNAKTLTQLVATEIKVQMARADVRQSQLAREIGKTEQWLSVRLRGRQPIDVNDLHLIATGLKVSVYDLLPPAETAAKAAGPQAIAQYLGVPVRTTDRRHRPADNRPNGHPSGGHAVTIGRTAYLARFARPPAA